MKNIKDIVILGAGASGMFCANWAMRKNKDVLILDKNNEPLKKLKISGGGKCNFTNKIVKENNYYTNGGNDTIKKAIEKFGSDKFINLVKKENIKFFEKTKGQLFCKTSSDEIVKMLSKNIMQKNLIMNSQIISVEKKDDIFVIKTEKTTIKAKKLVVATGGMSFQQLGATDIGYKIAKTFGIKIVEPRPALVPFILGEKDMEWVKKLQGIAVDAIVKCNEKSFRENILFTHFGLSGPAILQASLYWNSRDNIEIDMMPDIDIAKMLKEIRENTRGKKISSILTEYLPTKLVKEIITNDCFVSEISNKAIEEIGKKIKAWKIMPANTKGFKAAEVTKGGVEITEIDDKFEAKKVKNLFFIGEVLDVTGQLGGYNLQWAWTSGYIVGNNI